MSEGYERLYIGLREPSGAEIVVTFPASMGSWSEWTRPEGMLTPDGRWLNRSLEDGSWAEGEPPPGITVTPLKKKKAPQPPEGN